MKLFQIYTLIKNLHTKLHQSVIQFIVRAIKIQFKILLVRQGMILDVKTSNYFSGLHENLVEKIESTTYSDPLHTVKSRALHTVYIKCTNVLNLAAVPSVNLYCRVHV